MQGYRSLSPISATYERVRCRVASIAGTPDTLLYSMSCSEWLILDRNQRESLLFYNLVWDISNELEPCVNGKIDRMRFGHLVLPEP
jgi:hypothetical protein